MHDEILNADQLKLLPLMARFRREYYLVGGTAIALHIGHRRSVDFDMFKMSAINHKKNLDKIVASGFDHQVTRRVEEQMNLLVNGVKLTFFQYPFPVVPELFGELFSEKLFRAQLSYFDDVDYTEQVEYLIPNPPAEAEIKARLTEISLQDM